MFLEGELEERESLKGTIQHLKEEARDLRHELAIQKPTSKPLLGTNNVCGGADGPQTKTCNPSNAHHHSKHTPVAVITATRPSETIAESPITPSSEQRVELSPKC